MAAAPVDPDVVPNQYIVVFHDWVTSARGHAHVLAVQHGMSLQFTYEHAVRGFAATIPPGRLALLRRDPRVAFISANRVVAIAQQEVPTGVNRIEADVSPTAAIDGAVDLPVADINVAIIDTGIQSNHPDLNVVGGYNCMSSNTAAWADGNGHGSHVAGTVAARDNGIGVVGVAPDARLWAVRVLDNSGSGTTATVVCGIDWVTANAGANNIRVANMSLGGSGSDDNNCGNTNNDAMHKAICSSVAAGVTYVAAAGNSNLNFRSFVPAAYNEVLTVTAIADFNGLPGGGAAATCRTDVDDTRADFSNRTTKTSVDASHTIAAPGVCIRSTWIGSSYNTISGTSMASPNAAGAVALCLAGGACAAAGATTPAQIIAKLRADAQAKDSNNAYGFTEDPNSTTSNRYYGYLVFAGAY